MIFRREVWFNPPKDPTRIDIIIIIDKNDEILQ
jgi:hypothetical protein